MKVSIIIPMFNAGAYIKRSVLSALNQTYSSVEIICVDDGSTDNTRSVVKEIMEKYPGRITLLEQPNLGASKARNLGLSSASGQYVQFLDADDELAATKIANQIAAINSTDLPAIIIAPYSRIYSDGRSEQVVNCERDIWTGLLKSRLGCTCSNLWERSTLLKVGGWNENLKSSQEYDLMFRIVKVKNYFLVLTQNETTVHVVPGSISTARPRENWERYLRLRAEIFRFVQKEFPRDFNQLKEQYYSILFDAIRMVYPHSPGLALEVKAELLPLNYSPKVSSVTSANYVRLFRLFGFIGAERIRMFFKGDR